MTETPDTNTNHYPKTKFTHLSNVNMIPVVKELIRESIIENRVYLDNDDIWCATEIIYPLVFSIVFNPNYSIRHDENDILDLITFLVVRLA